MTVDTDFSLVMNEGDMAWAAYGSPPLTNPDALDDEIWNDFGAITTDGLSEDGSETRQAFKRWGDTSPYRTTVTDKTKTFDFAPLESNPDVLGAFFAVTSPTPTGEPVNEVQTVTVTGTPTGGNTVWDFEGDATDIAYNATTTAVATALQALSTIGSGNVAVTGSAMNYTITFQGALAGKNVSQINVTSELTGGTAPAVTSGTTTQGSAGNLLIVEDDTTGASDIRAFCFDGMDGTNHVRFYIPRGEVTARKGVTYNAATQTEYGMTITAYKDPTTGLSVRRFYLLDALVS